ncbi:hypothetical protein HAX54_014214 [Datura stramonium]|uniref:Uncharacterized protein n=1 Tax=Datura stramonium TaxID=4076 RepID=A0ABS8RYP3_DATST|nr:hypothetical protein [Datura stramonium]
MGVGSEENATSPVQHNFDDFGSTPPILGNKRNKQDVCISSSTLSKKSKSEDVPQPAIKLDQQKLMQNVQVKPTVYRVEPTHREPNEIFLLRQDLELFKKSVDNQFMDLQKIINSQFSKVMKAVKVKSQSDTEIIDSKVNYGTI